MVQSKKRVVMNLNRDLIFKIALYDHFVLRCAGELFKVTRKYLLSISRKKRRNLDDEKNVCANCLHYFSQEVKKMK